MVGAGARAEFFDKVLDQVQSFLVVKTCSYITLLSFSDQSLIIV